MPKSSYVYLKDRKGSIRVVLCLLEEGNFGWLNKNILGTFYGMAIRSNDDRHSTKTGCQLAYRRAVRASKYRRPCRANRPEIPHNLWELNKEHFNVLMKFTDNKVRGFEKAGFFDNKYEEMVQKLKELCDVS